MKKKETKVVTKAKKYDPRKDPFALEFCLGCFSLPGGVVETHTCAKEKRRSRHD
jgi:hypothetical protein